MDRDTLSIELAGIEAELRVLKKALTQLVDSPSSTKKVPHFADLCGIWKGKVDLSLEEIQEAEYRMKPFPRD